jgi:pyrimidine-nucleoside phosphorylase
MIATDLLRQKREGQALSDADIEAFLAAYTDGRVPDYQMSAMAMAIYFRGLDARELGAWTRAMLHSGDVLDLSDIPGRKVDKHSTGGVGDKISLPLAPLVAACGVKVPMISGRGLGHTGGTLDKLESIPGFSVNLDVPTYRRLVRDVGACLIGQTSRLAPADRKLYALRDVTSTVESIPLISSSIMSKKLAEGIDALVLDVKFGSGAFMREFERAELLAKTMVGIGASFGKDVVALLTDMDQPLGEAVGNALEVIESAEILKGRGPADVRELTLALGAEMLVLGHVAANTDEARARLVEAIDDGSAFAKFEEIATAQGGDARALSDYTRLPTARRLVEVTASRAGFVTAIQTDEVGRAAMLLGAGRQKVDDKVDPAVGLVLHKRVGDAVRAGDSLATLHVNDEAPLEAARRRLSEAFAFGDAPPAPRPLVARRVASA